MRGKAVIIAILFVTLLPTFVGADLERWMQGITFGCMGLLFLLVPPRSLLSGHLHWLFLALFLVPLAAFLPAAWVGVPAWRAETETTTAIQLPDIPAAEPWFTLDHLVLFAGGLLWTCYLLSRRWTNEERLLAMKFLAGAFLAFLVISFLEFSLQDDLPFLPFWEGQNYFGPFANRNHVATVLVMGAIVLAGCAYYDIKSKHLWRAGIWATGLIIAFAAVVVNESRAGVVFFFIGIGVWVALVARQNKSFTQLAVAGSALLFLAAGFFLFGEKTLDRFRNPDPEASLASAVKGERRVEVFIDTFRIIGQAPVFGVGLGNFDSAYARVRNKENPRYFDRVSQPDNDWLWFAAETGITGLLLSAMLVILLLAGAIPQIHRSRQRRHRAILRGSAFAAAAVFAVNGLVSIPGHRLGPVLIGILLLALAFRDRSPGSPSRLLAAGYRAAGIALILVGATWVTATAVGYPLPGPLGAEILADRITEAQDEKDFEVAGELLEEAISMQPLRYRNYYKRAVNKAEGGGDLEAAVEDFLIARFLEPIHPALPLGEMEVWFDVRPSMAIEPLQEAIRRDPKRRMEYFQRALDVSQGDPALRARLATFAGDDPELLLQFLANQSPEEFPKSLAQLLERDPALNSFNLRQKESLFGMWFSKGDRLELAAALSEHPDWQEAGWHELSRMQASSGDYRSALATALQYVPAPNLPRFADTTSVETLRSSFYANPSDASLGIRLYEAEKRRGNGDNALIALQKAGELPDCPDYAFYLLALDLGPKEQFEEAWKHLNLYIAKSVKR